MRRAGGGSALASRCACFLICSSSRWPGCSSTASASGASKIPVAWGFAIAEYVWWIALASGGTIVSALFYLTRSPWRSAINRIAESMMLSAAACAGLMPILHLGRPGLFYWLFPYPNVMGVWPQFRSPLLWDFVCLLCYILMSIMFYYVGLLPDLRHRARSGAATARTQIFYGILALGWRGSARHWQQPAARLFHHGGDHGADGHFGAQRRRSRFRRRHRRPAGTRPNSRPIFSSAR